MHPIVRIALALGSGLYTHKRVTDAQKMEVTEGQLILFNRQGLWGGHPNEATCSECGHVSHSNYLDACIACNTEFSAEIVVDTKPGTIIDDLVKAIGVIIIGIMLLGALGFACMVFLFLLSI